MIAIREKICTKVKNVCIGSYLKMKQFRDDARGMGTIEVVLIVAILVALALLFKTFINKYANNIFANIESKTSSAFEDW